jgi:hypothetical protein
VRVTSERATSERASVRACQAPMPARSCFGTSALRMLIQAPPSPGTPYGRYLVCLRAPCSQRDASGAKGLDGQRANLHQLAFHGDKNRLLLRRPCRCARTRFVPRACNTYNLCVETAGASAPDAPSEPRAMLPRAHGAARPLEGLGLGFTMLPPHSCCRAPARTHEHSRARARAHARTHTHAHTHTHTRARMPNTPCTHSQHLA